MEMLTQAMAMLTQAIAMLNQAMAMLNLNFCHLFSLQIIDRWPLTVQSGITNM